MHESTRESGNLSRPVIGLISAVVAIAIFLLDIYTPLGVAGGVPYVALFVLSWWYRSVRFVYGLAVLASLLTLVGYFLSEPGATHWVVVTNRVYALIAIWLSALVLRIAIVSRNRQGEQLVELVQRGEELENYRRRQSLNFKSTPMGAIEWSPGFEVLDWNAAAEKIFGFSKLEVYGRHIKDHILPKEAAPIVDSIWESLLSGRGGTRSVNFNVTKDGRTRLCNWYNTPLIDHDGTVIGVSSLVEDITEQHLSAQKDQTRNQVLSMSSREEPLSDVLASLAEGLELQIPNTLASILLLDESGENLLTGAAPNLPDFYVQALDGVAIGDGVGSCGTAAYLGERVIVENIEQHPYWEDFRELAAAAGLAACWSEPMKDHEGKVLGTFAIYHALPRSPSVSDLECITEAAALAAIAIEKARANESLRIASMVYEHSMEAVMITDAKSNIISVNPHFEAVTGYQAVEVVGKNPNILKSNKNTVEFYRDMWSRLNESGSWQGEIWNRRKGGEDFLELLAINAVFNSDGSVHRYISIFMDITKSKEAEELIWKRTNYDSLTSLPNRRLLTDHLGRALIKSERNDESVALLLLDINRFKEVNDQLGHHRGDELLQTAAARITESIGDADMVARIGGDEFAIVIEEVDSAEDIDYIARQIMESLSAPFSLGDDKAYVSASIGIAFYPADSADVNELIKHADQAMYAAKDGGRQGLNYYTNEIQEKVLGRALLIKDLREAIAEKQFHLCYQPIVDLSTNEIYKAEALIRWIHPERGFVGPDVFIPVSEETGLVVEIGNWVMEEAASRVLEWRAAYNPSMQVSINVSPVQFQSDPNLCRSWIAYLEKQGLAGDGLVLEITEGLLMEDAENIMEQLKAFHDAGLPLSLDDFGTGYSSLSYLKKFDMDFLKIDRSFVMNLTADSDDMALCEAIIVMAHKLKLKVIAEGIETEEQRDLLVAAGCDYGQGYLFSRPVPADEFEKLLS